MLAIRVSKGFQDVPGFVAALAAQSKSLIIYQHEADDDVSRTHIHALCDSPSCSTDSMKNWIKKDLHVTAYPKSDWAFTTVQSDKKTPVDINYITYMSKGILDPMYNKGFTQADIDRLKSNWIEHPKVKEKAVLYKTIKEETPSQKKMRIWDMLEECVRRCRTYKDTSMSHSLPPTQIVRVLYQVFTVENHCIIGRYKYRDYYDHIMMTVEPVSTIRDIVTQFEFKVVNPQIIS